MKLPSKYAWLSKIGTLPKMVQKGLAEYGTLEVRGSGNNAKILTWAKETGLKNIYTADSIPWCGLYMAIVAKRANYSAPANPLWALNWAKFGKEAGQPGLGDVLAFTRTGGGHVGIYIAEDSTTYHVLGGNQSDAVNITRIAKNRLYAARRPRFLIGQPKTVRPYIMGNTNDYISTNEA